MNITVSTQLKVYLNQLIQMYMLQPCRDVHMIIEGQGLRVSKGQYACATIFFSGLYNTICRLINVKLMKKLTT